MCIFASMKQAIVYNLTEMVRERTLFTKLMLTLQGNCQI